MQLSPFTHVPRAMRLFPSRSLQRLVLLHGDGCARLGLDLAAIEGEDDPAVRSWLGERDGRLPAPLAEDLARIEELSDNRGAGVLAEVAARRGVKLSSLGMDAVEVAVAAFLDHRGLFDAAHGHRVVRELRSTAEFAGRAVTPARAPEAAELRELELRLGRHFERRSRSAHCRVTFAQDEDLTIFTVAHGSLVRADESLEGNVAVVRDAEAPVYLQERAVRYRPHRRDVVVYDGRVGHLRIHAGDAPTTHAYRCEFGEVLHRDAAWFGTDEVVSLEPLIRLGKGVEAPTAGLRAVRLVGLVLRHVTGHRGTIALDSEDIWPYLEARLVDPLGNAELLEAIFHVTPSGTDRCIPVKVRMPNHVHYGHAPDHLFRPYLEERGFYAAGAQDAAR